MESSATNFVRVDDEPLHVQRWKSAGVRLVDVQFPPHTTSLWHQHVHYGVYIAITPIVATEQSVHDAAPKALNKKRGDVFCRDHTKDRLTHVVSTSDEPMRIIEVELVRDERHLAADAVLPPHVHRCVVQLHEDDRCRVHRMTLLRGVEEADSVHLVLPTDAVLVALDDCTVTITNPTADDKMHADHARFLKGQDHAMARGDDVALVAGTLTLRAAQFDGQDVAAFILTEVF